MRRAPTLAGLVPLGLVAVAAAASSGSVSIMLSPDRPSAAAALTVTAHGPFPQASGTLTSTKLTTQEKFTSSPKSVAVLCTAAQETGDSCPAASKIGAGTATVTVSDAAGTFSRQDTLTFNMFLGVPVDAGDIASVNISGTDSLLHQSGHATGRLFTAPAGGLELLFDRLPSYSLPPGTKVTLDQLSFRAHAVRTVGNRKHRGGRRRVRYSLITNPPQCAGAWHATLTLSFSGGATDSRVLSVACQAG
jgi:hypothetical protein